MNANLCSTGATILLAALIANIPFCLPAAQPPEVTDRDLRARLDHAVQESYDPKSHSNTVHAAASASAAIGLTNYFVSYLLNRLQQQEVSGESRYQLAAAVAKFGPAAAAAAPILSRWLPDPDTIVQYHAFVALGQVNPQSPIPFEALERIQRLGSVGPEVQYATLLAMQQQAASRAAEIPIVIAIVKETDHRGLKCFALETLGLIGPAHTGALRTILACVVESDEFISETGVRALRQIDTAHAELVPVLAEALSSSSWKARYYAAEALRKFGPRAKPAVPALAAALSRADSTDKHYWVGAYLEALRAVGPGAVEAADPIVRLLAERSPLYRNRSKYEVEQLRAFMLVTLSEVGIPDAALPFILDALANSNTLNNYDPIFHTRDTLYPAGAIAAGALGARAADAVPFLLRALRPEFRDYPLTFESYFDKKPESRICTSPRIEAIRALGKIGPAAKTATSVLTEFARREERPQRFSQMPLLSDEARTALALIGGQSAAHNESPHSKSESFPSSAKATE